MNYRKIIEEAHEKKYAIPHFNFDSLQIAKQILITCEEEKCPVFLAVSMSAVKYMGGFYVVKNLVDGLKKDLNITIPVMLHLDHSKTIEDTKKAIDVGFDSVMIDYSEKLLTENIEATKEIRNYNKNVILECEVGLVGKNGGENIIYAEVEDCEEIIKNTDADILAAAIGTVHGLYKMEQNINVDRLKEINETLNMPLVLHGGSGTDTEKIKETIQNGISKINVNTAIKQAFHKGICEYINNNPNEFDYRKYVANGLEYVDQTLKEHINLFGCKNTVK